MTGTLALIYLPLLLVVGLMPLYIGFLKRQMLGQYIREDGPQSHQAKAGTPTAGGVIVLLAIGIAILLWRLSILLPGLLLGGNMGIVCGSNVWVVIGATLVLGLLGFSDDWLKIAKKKNKGVTGYTKLAIQMLVGLGVGAYAMQLNNGNLNWFGVGSLHLGWLYPLFAAVVVTGTSNAVNLTDGLDGLATGTSIVSFATLSALLLGVWDMPDLGYTSLVILSALFGFWLFNRKPARIFMGDTGSLALGGALASLAILAGQEVWLLLLGGIFVLEALSVMLQVLSFKTTGKRIFRMSPLHHHFELGGLTGHGKPWPENRVVWTFIAGQCIFCALCYWRFIAQ